VPVTAGGKIETAVRRRTAPANGVQYANGSAVWMSLDVWIVGPELERALVVRYRAVPHLGNACSVCPRLAAPRTGFSRSGKVCEALAPAPATRRARSVSTCSWAVPRLWPRLVPFPIVSWDTSVEGTRRGRRNTGFGASRPLLSGHGTRLGVTARSPTLTRC
jgi:hypothetical protein